MSRVLAMLVLAGCAVPQAPERPQAPPEGVQVSVSGRAEIGVTTTIR